jgi:BASS family bile acid:Na+ symporter
MDAGVDVRSVARNADVDCTVDTDSADSEHLPHCFSLGLDCGWEDALWLFRRPGLLARSILSMNVLMVLFAIAIAIVFKPPPAIRIALVALAISPVPPIFPKKQQTCGGTSSYAIGLVVAAALFAVVLIPCWLEVLGHRYEFEVDMGLRKIVPTIFISILIPLFLGILIHKFAPAFAARAVKPVSLVAMVLLVVALLPVLFTMAPAMWAEVGNGVIWMMVLFGVVGLVVGHLLGGPAPDNRTVLAMATSARHPGIAISIAGLNFPEHKKEVMVVILFHLLVGAIVAMPYSKWRATQHAKVMAE